MRIDLIGKFIEKLDIFISDCEIINEDGYLMEHIDCTLNSSGWVSIYQYKSFLYPKNSEKIKVSWCDDLIEIYISYPVSSTSFRRNELDPIILCLEQPNLRKFTDEFMNKVISIVEEIHNKIIVCNQSKEDIENES